MNELIIFIMFCVLMLISAGIVELEDFIKRKRAKNDRTRRIRENVQGRSGTRTPRGSEKQSYPLFSEQKSLRKGSKVCRYA
jgi:hypothetical protein